MATEPSWAIVGETRGIAVPNLSKYEHVLRQADAWPLSWSGALREPGRIWRADVFDVAGQWRSQQVPARQLLGAVCVWGHGSNGYGPWRTAKTVASSKTGDELERALEPLRAEFPDINGLLSSFTAMSSRSAARLPWFRAPFFTKLLYFAGYRRGAGGVQPLILDSVVAAALPENVEIRRPHRRVSPAWTPDEWLTYLRYAADNCTTEPDQVELQLFETNRNA